jgi:signal transduction histidine kinase
MDATTSATGEIVSAQLRRQYQEIAAIAGGLAHEVRNPLSTIRMNLELALEELAASENPVHLRLLRRLRTIQQECGHVEAILDDFLQFARAGELFLEECQAEQILNDFLDFYGPEARQHHVDLRRHVAADLPAVRVDRRLIRQVLANLVRNAQQAMPDGGLIEIQAFRRGESIVIEIIDTGCGIPEAALSRIFDVFYSTKSGGSGLGLPTVRKIMEAHGGSVNCESEPGRGTRMTLALPIAN